MLDNGSDTIILEGNSAPVDMATLSLTNHTIMTVGSFGWLIGWLTGGITVYYKYPDGHVNRGGVSFQNNRIASIVKHCLCPRHTICGNNKQYFFKLASEVIDSVCYVRLRRLILTDDRITFTINIPTNQEVNMPRNSTLAE
jgi:hypothetical protein